MVGIVGEDMVHQNSIFVLTGELCLSDRRIIGNVRERVGDRSVILAKDVSTAKPPNRRAYREALLFVDFHRLYSPDCGQVRAFVDRHGTGESFACE